MTLWQRITREPNAILGLVTATTGLLILFGVPLTVEQAGGIFIFVGALVGLVRFIVTPATEVVAQESPSGEIVAGPASWISDGHPVVVDPVDFETDDGTPS